MPAPNEKPMDIPVDTVKAIYRRAIEPSASDSEGAALVGRYRHYWTQVGDAGPRLTWAALGGSHHADAGMPRPFRRGRNWVFPYPPEGLPA